MRIELALGEALPPVLGEADELAQLFQNLIDNAIKYARPDTAITIGVGPSRRFREGFAIKVRDRGDGIPRQHLPPTGLVDATSILRSVAQTLDLRAEARGMRIELQLDDNLPPVLGDEDELAQLFQNLIDNAIKYAKRDTAITVAAVRSNKVRPGVAVSVRDCGEGIPRLHLPRLTERFYRIDTARSREMGGTGLGLAIVKHIVNRHRGVLEIDSELGQGSVFTAHLRIGVPRGVENDAGTTAARRVKAS